MGWIEERDRGAKVVYRARYRDPSGKERVRQFDRKRDAQRHLREQETAKDKGTWVDPDRGKVTLEKWARGWLANRTDLKPKTRASYQGLLNSLILPEFGRIPLSAIRPMAVEQWVAELTRQRSRLTGDPLSESRVRQAYGLLSSMLESAVAKEHLHRNPCRGVENVPAMPDREMEFLTAEEVKSLAREITPPYGVLVYTLAYGGLRWAEAVGLKVKRVDLLRRKLTIAETLSEVNGELVWTVTKNRQNRVVEVPGFVRDYLRDHIAGKEPEDLVFTSPKGKALRGTFRRRTWDPAVEKADLSPTVTPHTLRHTCASLLYHRGATPLEISRHLGHKNLRVTLDTYTHLFDKGLEGIMEGLEEDHHAATPTRPEDAPTVVDFPGMGL